MVKDPLGQIAVAAAAYGGRDDAGREAVSAEELPDWFYPPPPGGWTADDLDQLPPSAPRRVELIDGALIMMSPQTEFHSQVMRRLANALEDAAPEGIRVAVDMTVKLGHRQRPDPDVVVSAPRGDEPKGRRRTFYLPEEVLLVVEVVSDESEERDRYTKPIKYAAAGIPHFWRIEEESDLPVVHVFELEKATDTFVPTGIFRDRVKLDVPFPLDIDVKALAR
jgi:Uma2 family endonuclease